MIEVRYLGKQDLSGKCYHVSREGHDIVFVDEPATHDKQNDHSVAIEGATALVPVVRTDNPYECARQLHNALAVRYACHGGIHVVVCEYTWAPDETDYAFFGWAEWSNT